MTFHRYDNADERNDIVMPSDILDARVSNLIIGELINKFEEFSGDPHAAEAYPWADRFIMGFPLARWQRPLRWTEQQKISFITSIWYGVDVGSYMINGLHEFCRDKDGKVYYRKFSDVLLDGQQRLAAIQGYLLGEFAVPDAKGTPRYWRDLSRVERRRFASTQFARATIRSWDEEHLRMAYDLRAFSGVAHEENERAMNGYNGPSA